MKYMYISTTALLTFLFCTQPKVERQNNSGDTNHNQLRKVLVETISKYKATVGLSVIELESGETMSINKNTGFAMQSVYKFPLALALLSDVEKGKISLQQKVFLSKQLLDRFPRSHLKRQNPGSNFYMSVDSLMMYMIAYSDNLACDMLFELIGGTQVADNFIHKQGFPDIHLKYTELEIGENPNRMYLNSSTPTEMANLLKAFYEEKIISATSKAHLLKYMINDSTTHNRLLGNLPPGTKVAHKTGTGSTSDTLINACNDVGIIYLPNGNHLAIAVFVMNAKEKYEDTEKLIATLTRQIFDYYIKK